MITVVLLFFSFYANSFTLAAENSLCDVQLTGSKPPLAALIEWGIDKRYLSVDDVASALNNTSNRPSFIANLIQTNPNPLLSNALRAALDTNPSLNEVELIQKILHAHRLTRLQTQQVAADMKPMIQLEYLRQVRFAHQVEQRAVANSAPDHLVNFWLRRDGLSFFEFTKDGEFKERFLPSDALKDSVWAIVKPRLFFVSKDQAYLFFFSVQDVTSLQVLKVDFSQNRIQMVVPRGIVTSTVLSTALHIAHLNGDLYFALGESHPIGLTQTRLVFVWRLSLSDKAKPPSIQKLGWFTGELNRTDGFLNARLNSSQSSLEILDGKESEVDAQIYVWKFSITPSESAGSLPATKPVVLLDGAAHPQVPLEESRLLFLWREKSLETISQNEDLFIHIPVPNLLSLWRTNDHRTMSLPADRLLVISVAVGRALGRFSYLFHTIQLPNLEVLSTDILPLNGFESLSSVFLSRNGRVLFVILSETAKTLSVFEFLHETDRPRSSAIRLIQTLHVSQHDLELVRLHENSSGNFYLTLSTKGLSEMEVYGSPPP